MIKEELLNKFCPIGIIPNNNDGKKFFREILTVHWVDNLSGFAAEMGREISWSDGENKPSKLASVPSSSMDGSLHFISFIKAKEIIELNKGWEK